MVLEAKQTLEFKFSLTPDSILIGINHTPTLNIFTHVPIKPPII